MALDTQQIEILGHNRLIDEILRAGLEVAIPARDRGIDLIAYADLETEDVRAFVARPIQMKAASSGSFSIQRKYRKFPSILLAYIWHLDSLAQQIVTYALDYQEALSVADAMGYTKTESWLKHGVYVTTKPGKELRKYLEPYAMTPGRWWDRIVKANTPDVATGVSESSAPT